MGFCADHAFWPVPGLALQLWQRGSTALAAIAGLCAGSLCHHCMVMDDWPADRARIAKRCIHRDAASIHGAGGRGVSGRNTQWPAASGVCDRGIEPGAGNCTAAHAPAPPGLT